jgi:uncharacterized paraquat-inducible protein A
MTLMTLAQRTIECPHCPQLFLAPRKPNRKRPSLLVRECPRCHHMIGARYIPARNEWRSFRDRTS